MIPSSDHGVTTVVTGNCGVGFAPCRPDDRKRLVELMEGVEDIPEVVMTTGLEWNWETFPEYLDLLASREFDVDIATQLPHSCLRVYVMGKRGADREPATDADLDQMRRLTREAMEAGAVGVGTSRTIFHRFPDGSLVPSKDAGEAELNAIAAGMRDAGHGVLEAVFDPDDLEKEFDLLARVAKTNQVPLTFSLFQTTMRPEGWRQALDLLDKAAAENIPIKAQVIGRPTGMVLGLDLSLHPFSLYPSYKAIAHLSLAERVAEMRKPEVRARILADQPHDPSHPIQQWLGFYDKMFPLADPPHYEPSPDEVILGRARAAGVSPQELLYDMLLEDEGHSMIFLALANFLDGNLDAVHAMMTSPHTVLGLGDGGAHYGMICDAGFPTFMLTYWVRDRDVGGRLRLEEVVKELSSRPAATVGLNDRGMVAKGYRADLNVIDMNKLTLHRPVVTFDLPASGRRLRQAATGFTATLVAGEVTYRDGMPTGALPGRLVRGTRATA